MGMNGKTDVEELVIVGAGICGLATAVALRRVGIEAVVLEKAESLRTTGAALTLASNAWLALDALGVSHHLTHLYPPLIKNIITDVSTGATQEVTLSEIRSGLISKTVHRKTLLEVLAKELPSETIRFSCKIESISTLDTNHDHQGSTIAILHMEDGSIIKTKVLIGCDGVHSKVSEWLGLKEVVDSGRSGLRGISVFPQGHGFEHNATQFLHSGLRGGFAPLSDTEVYWGLVIGESVPQGLEKMTYKTPPEVIQKQVLEHYCKGFPSVYKEIISNLDLSTVSWAPLKLRVPWNVAFGKLSKGTITVGGDAMHPMTPDLGQGGCSALEDAVILGRHIGNSYLKNGRQLLSSEVSKAIEDYVEARRWHVARVIMASFLSGWVQQDGSTWLKRFFRDAIFYKFFPQLVSSIIRYDCGKLPDLSNQFVESDHSSKFD